MDLLLIGGTRFSGRLTAELALGRGHRVTLLHRGATGAELFPDAEHLLADRDGGMGVVDGRRFDAVIDFCGFRPGVVRQSVEALSDSGHYTFVSSVSAYAEGFPRGATEDAPLAEPPEDEDTPLDPTTYGPLKVACERVVQRGFGARAAVVRPGFVVGRFDPTDRLASLVRRAAAGGEMLLYGPPEGPVQFVDALDLAAFLLHVAEHRIEGAFHAVHPRGAVTMRDLVAEARAAAGADTRVVWADPAWLAERLGDDRERAFPMWDPEPESPFHDLDSGRAAAAGLRSRPLAETVRDVLTWDASRGPDAPRPHGLSAERERALLAELRG